MAYGAFNAGGGGASDSAESLNITAVTIPRGRMGGDVDDDGQITQADQMLVMQHYNELITLTGEDFIAADVNQSGAVDMSDASLIGQVVSGTLPKDSFGEISGNWTVNPNAATEAAQYYADIQVAGMTAASAAVLTLTSQYADRFHHAECVAGALRVWVIRPPVEAIPALLVWRESGGGGAVIAAQLPDSLERAKALCLPKYRFFRIAASSWEDDGDGGGAVSYEIPGLIADSVSSHVSQRIDIVPGSDTMKTKMEEMGFGYTLQQDRIVFWCATVPSSGFTTFTLYLTEYQSC